MKKLLAAVTVLAVSTAQANTIYVDDDAPPGGDGLGWNTAYRFLQDALAVAAVPANAINEIRVAQGTYRPDRDEVTPNGTGDRTTSFQLIDGVAVQGGYAGVGAPDPDDRNRVLYETVFTGDLAGDDAPSFENNLDNSHHVVYADGNDDTAILDGVTITAGNADGAELEQQGGGGMYSNVGTPTLANCTFLANVAVLDGGGLYNYFNDGTVSACTFVANLASRNGGAVYNSFFATQLTNCQFSENLAFGDGGGVAGDAVYDGCVFTANIALDNGGGFWGDGTATNCTFVDNLAGNDGGGAAPRNSATMTGCLFDGNVADKGGGVYQYLPLDVVACTFVGNTADLGGAIYCFADALTLTNCTFEGYTAIDGAGLYNAGTSPTVTGCMFTANTAGSRGGGIYNGTGAAPQISGCTFASNLAVTGGGISNNEATPVIDTCSFLANSVTGIGGGMLNLLSTVTVTDSTFDGNVALHGGGMSSNTATITVTGSLFVNNRAEVNSQSEGGGMSNKNQSIATMMNCVFQNNLARRSGGGIYNELSDAEVTLCTFQNNTPSGMSNSFSSPTVSDCTFDGHSGGAALTLTDFGGGTIIDCDFSNNTGGGAISVRSTDPNVINCTFVGNSSARGGAASVYQECSPHFVNCLFEGNMAEEHGGAFYHGEDSAASLINCRFVENSCLQWGGAIMIEKCTPTLVNCIIAGNMAMLGGGVYISFDSAADITNSTIIGNTADEGGGLWMDCSGPLNALTSSIVRDNQAFYGAPEIDGRLAVTYCNIEGGFPGAGNIDADPLFVDPDGPDDFLGTYDDNNYDLLPGSPCIDAGDNTAIPLDSTDIDNDGNFGERIPLDVAGNPRFFNDLGRCDTGIDDVFNDNVDVGAFEFQSMSPMVDCNGNGLTDQCDIAFGIKPDCNENGIPDDCDITSGFSIDCDGNGVPDECDVVVTLAVASGQLSPIYDGSPQSFTIIDAPTAVDDVILSFTVIAYLPDPVGQIEVDINGVLMGSLFCEASFCAQDAEISHLVVPAAAYNTAVAGADAIITMTPNQFVSNACDPSFITVAVSYESPDDKNDANSNGVPDDCDAPGDIDGDGVVGFSDFLALLAFWGPCENCNSCLADIDGDCLVGITDMLLLLGNWS